MESSTYDLVEAASRLAQDNGQLEVLLRTWERLGRQQGRNPEYLDELQLAQSVIRQSANLPQAMARLRLLAPLQDSTTTRPPVNAPTSPQSTLTATPESQPSDVSPRSNGSLTTSSQSSPVLAGSRRRFGLRRRTRAG